MKKALIGIAALVSACACDYRPEPVIWELPYQLERQFKGNSILEVEKYNTPKGQIWRYTIDEKAYCYLIEGKRPTALIREKEGDTLFKTIQPDKLKVPDWVTEKMLIDTQYKI